MHTEEQAKTKWCPFAREVYVPPESHCPGTVANRDYDSAPYGCRCIASECMAWRWDVTLNDQLLADARAEYADMPDPTPPLKDTDIWADFLKSRHGYCGLAGKPDDR